jgi:hypothetical protein
VDVFAIRHGETAWSLSGQHTGTTDIPLTDSGRLLAKRMRSVLAAKAFELVLCSPMHRARETCELAGWGNKAVIDPDLLEWNYGEYEGLTPKQIQEIAPGWLIFRDGCPGGTSARRRESGPSDCTVARYPRRYCAVCTRTRPARVRGALDRVVPRRRSTLSAEYGHAVCAELLPRNIGCTDLERASPRLDRSEGVVLESLDNRRAIHAAAKEQVRQSRSIRCHPL